MSRHGRIRVEKEMLATLVVQQVCNITGSSTIGKLMEPWIVEGADKEAYTELPIQANPIVMNVKGSSAAGKSTLRPLQHKLAQELGMVCCRTIQDASDTRFLRSATTTTYGEA